MRNEVYHNFRLILFKNRFDYNLVNQITFHEAEIFKLLQLTQVDFLQTHIIVVVHVIQIHDLSTLHRGEQPLYKVGTDEACYTRDKMLLFFRLIIVLFPLFIHFFHFYFSFSINSNKPTADHSMAIHRMLELSFNLYLLLLFMGQNRAAPKPPTYNFWILASPQPVSK